MKDFWKRRRNKRIAASALAVIMAGFLVWGIFPWQAAATENTVADDLTINNWHDSNALDDSTKNVGRIWTDKSVSTEDVTLTSKSGDTKTVEKNNDSDFLVGLSALSSTAELLGQTSVPLDIVLVLDVSGSMDDTSGSYEEVYDLDKSKTYYIFQDSSYTEVKYDRRSQTWYYQGWIMDHDVTPKTSATDTDPNHVQFYSRSTAKKIDTLKNAVNGFIDQAAAANDQRSDESKQTRISLVKFAGDKSTAVGNDTYRSNGYYYNYTQVVKGYTTCTSDKKASLTTAVNELKPAGATAADNAMDLAESLIEKSKTDEAASADRKNVKRIVIFFTDGQPNHQTGFDGNVANDAIKKANTIKSDASIYTIGVFSAADASDTKGQFNAYMHAMSSNYPDATSYNNLGTRATDGDGKPAQFYKAATDAAELNNIFNEIAAEIVSSAQSPTQVDQGESPNQSGYITLTDQLGDYMQVDDINTLVYANKEYKYSSKDEEKVNGKTTITYHYRYDIPETNHVYPEGTLDDLDVTVEKAIGENSLQTGDLVTVKIPANLIPLRYYQITDEGKMTIDETYPMRLFYDVSLKDGVADKIENPDAALQDYIKANKDDEGQVHFYTNKYDKESKDENSSGIGAYAHFEPATTNDFYYFQNDEVLYTDEACKTPVTSAIDTSGSTIYYYQRDYYELGSDGKAVSKINTVQIPGNSNLLLSGYAVKDKKTGQYYIPAGTPRTTSLSYFTEDKAQGANKTNTATTSIKPVWEENFKGDSVTTYLGNNGRMTFDLPGELDITKTVNAEEGHAVPDSLKDQEFTYKLELTAGEGTELKAEYTAQKYTGAKADGETFKIKPGDTFTLKDGQTLKIYGLAAGTAYTVTETKAEHFAAAAAQTNAGNNAATGTNDNNSVFAKGTITGEDTAVVNYTNTYKADPGPLDGSADLKAKKEFELADGSSAWEMKYLQGSQFTFFLTADSEGAPMPKDAVETAAGVKASVKTVKKGDISKAFDDITFTKPGTYQYRITEKDPGADRTRGVSYSYAAYTVTVKVTDENGLLKADAVMKKIRDDGGAELTTAATVEDHTAVFKNVYDAESETVTAEANKQFTDHTGNKALNDGDYTFRITPITANAPLPGGAVKKSETTNTGIGVKFKSITFTAADAEGATRDNPKTYEYWMEEVIPDGANADNKYTVNGVTYDPTRYKIRLNIYVENVDGKDTVIVDRTYLNADGTAITTSVPVFRNSYRAESVALTGDTALKGEKTLTGRDMKDGEKFEFTLTAGDNSTAKAIEDKVVTIAANGDKASVSGGKNGQAAGFKFGDVTFTKEGTYTFDIKENVPDQKAGGMTYDRHTTKATVVVTDDKENPGKLKAAVSYDNGTVSDAKDKAVFKNKYEASFAYDDETGGLLVEKVLNGRTMKAGEFEFTITSQGDTPAVSDADKSFVNPNQRGSGQVDSMQKLRGLTFTQDNIGKPYKYLVKEKKGSANGVTYDETRYLVVIEAVDNGDGTLHTVTTITPQTKDDDGNYTKSGTPAVFDSSVNPDQKPSLRFTNSYEAGAADPTSITTGFNKVLTGREWKDSDKFIFTIVNTQKPDGVETAPMPTETAVTVTKADLKNGKAPVDFGSITFDKAGVYKYKVTEQLPTQAGENTIGMNYDTAPRTITVTVTDDGTGKLTAAVTAVENSKTFTNKYVTEDLPLDTVCGIKVTKVLYGHDMAAGQFEFSIKAKDKVSADKLKIAEEDGATFGSQKAADGETVTLLDSLQLTMKQEDVGKTYSYTFAETKGSDKGYTYDENTYRLDITTNDAGDGTLTAAVVLTNTKTNTKIFEKIVNKAHPALGEDGAVIPFVNYYNGSTDVAGGTRAAISADKTLNGRNLKAGEFSFKLATRPGRGNASVLETRTNGANGSIAFDALSYRTSDKAAGSGTILSQAVEAGYATKSVSDSGKTVYTLNYRVSEDTSSLPAGVTAATASFDFTVTVTDNGDGTLTAVTNYPEGKDKFEFINTYGAEAVPVEINGSKILNAADGLTPADITGKFSFTLEAVTDGAPMPEKTTVQNDAAGNIDFGNITFSLDLLQDVTSASDADQSDDVERPAEGETPVAVDKSRTKTFEYKVTETGSASGVTNDSAKTKTFKLTLTDDGNGSLTVTKDPAQGPLFTFTNRYTVGQLPSSVTDQIKVNKELTGRDLKKGEFSFELLEDGKVAAKGTNDADGNVTFDRITYTEPGTHVYTVREADNGLGGVTYDDQTYNVVTTITDNGDGTLKAEHKAFAVIDGKELAPVEKITFANKYEARGTTAAIGAVKRLTGKELKDGQFTFQLKDGSGKVIDEARNDETGAISFKALKFDKAGTYHYTVSEVNDKQKEIAYDSSEKAVTITVKDSTSGYLEAQVESEDQLIFTNAYEAAGGNGGIGGHGTRTGDNFPLWIPILLMLAAAAGGGALFICRRNHR